MLFVLVTAICMAQAAVPVAPLDPESLEFLGFSANERASAWRATFRRPAPHGGAYHFRLIKLTDNETQQSLAVFRDSALAMRSSSGRPLPLKDTDGLADNPEFAGALPSTLWQRLQKRARLSSVAQEFKDTVIRIAADEGIALSAQAKDKVLNICAKGSDNASLGYTAVARLFEGEMRPIGHFRFDASATQKAPKGHLRGYFSHTGRLIVLVNYFEVNGHKFGYETVLAKTNPDNPIGATGTGTLPMIEAQSRSVYNKFYELHPQAIAYFDKWIGKYF